MSTDLDPLLVAIIRWMQNNIQQVYFSPYASKNLTSKYLLFLSLADIHWPNKKKSWKNTSDMIILSSDSTAPVHVLQAHIQFLSSRLEELLFLVLQILGVEVHTNDNLLNKNMAKAENSTISTSNVLPPLDDIWNLLLLLLAEGLVSKPVDL